MNSCALVTGASSGIGKALAEVLASHQHDLILTARNQVKLKEIKTQLESVYGIKVYVFPCDLAQAGAVVNLVEEIKQEGLNLDILINNAGIGDWGLFADCQWSKQEKMIQLNILGLTHLTRMVLPEMVKRGHGKILNVASTAAFQPGPLMSVYYATKAYVLSFSLALGHELRDKGVMVTCLCPGPTQTNFQETASINDIRFTHGRKIPEAIEVAKYGYKSLMCGKSVVIHGNLNKFITIATRLVPVAVTLKCIRYMQDSYIKTEKINKNNKKDKWL